MRSILSTRAFAGACVLALFALPTLIWPLQASEGEDVLPRPTGAVILTVTGAITRTNAPGRAEFDAGMLEALGIETLTTSTSWTDGPQDFEGVRASRLLEAVGANGTEIDAVALNDYVADIPIATIKEYRVLLALRQNGVTLTPRDKGPVWIVFPRDEFPELNDPRIDIRWVWQLRSIEVR